MYKPIVNHLRDIALSTVCDLRVSAVSAGTEGDVIKQVYRMPKLKPPRRKPSVQNESQREDYHQNDMEKRRNEEGDKGQYYHKLPSKIKEWRKEQRKKLKEKFNPAKVALMDQELNFWTANKKLVSNEEFGFICDRRGFSEDERHLMAEELRDAGLL